MLTEQDRPHQVTTSLIVSKFKQKDLFRYEKGLFVVQTLFIINYFFYDLKKLAGLESKTVQKALVLSRNYEIIYRTTH